MSSASSLDALIRPASIAIAGATADPGKLGALPLQFLRRFEYPGAIYPINPRLDEVGGLRCHRSLSAVDRPIDLLVVAVGAERIPALLEDAAPDQVRNALVLSSNFAEAGPGGERMQHELTALAQRKGIRLLGPNSVGVVNLWDRTVASISQVFDRGDLAPGPVAFITQSGAVGTAITALARERGIGIGYFISTGNEADLEFADFCDHFVDDPRVSVIAGYVESVRDGAKFMRAARRALAAGKPVLLLKVGTTEIGQRAVRSHTGALAGSDDVYRAVFAAQGIVRAPGIEALVDALTLFVAYPGALPEGSAKRVAVLSHSGGAGVMMSDAAIEHGLAMPRPSASLATALRERLPAYAALDNPIDMTANVIFDPRVMTQSVLDAAQSGDYDAVMLCVNLIWRQGDALAEELVAARRQTDRVVAVTWIGAKPGPLERLVAAGVPVYGDPLRCVRAVAARLQWESARRASISDASERAASSRIDPPSGCMAQQRLLERYDIDVAPARLVQRREDAWEAAAAIGYPVAAKLVAASVPHKTDVGGVVLDIGDATALARAVDALTAIPCSGREGILVQKMIEDRDARELFAGVTRDLVFGPIVVCGLGGIYVEVLRDVVMHPAPLDAGTAVRLLRSARFYPMLAGARGRPECDVDALARLLARMSSLACDAPWLQALDLNPISVSPRRAVVVDFKFEVAPTTPVGARG